MIVVVGLPAYADSPDSEKCAGGLAVEVAAAATRRGGKVELVGKVGNDGAGDAIVVALGRMGVGHAALVRDPLLPTPVLAAVTPSDAAAEIDDVDGGSRLLPEDPTARPSLDAGDIDLALKFLPQAGVVVLADALPDAAITVAAEGAAFATARLIVLVPTGAVPPAVADDATVLEMPADDDGSFGRLVGVFAAALDAGTDPKAAFREAVSTAGWEPSAE
jgi:sugar/nucleoside kinase (ribokinase family)